MSHRLRLLVCESDGRSMPVEVTIDRVILVGYSGRDRESVEAHISELAELGVAPPPRVPAMYTVAPELLTTGSELIVHGSRTSGEAEFVLLPSPHGVLVGVGSDHTDREREVVDVAKSKALCGKVVSDEVWPLESVEAHWDELELRAWNTDDGGRRLYQEGRLAVLLRPADLLAEVEREGMDSAGRVVFSGTLPALGGFGFGNRFEVELYDPLLRRRLRIAYDVVNVGASG